MRVNLKIDSESKTWDVSPNETLLHALRRNGYFGAKHGCENSKCGASTVGVWADEIPMIPESV